MEKVDFAGALAAGKLVLSEWDASAFVRITSRPGTEPYWGKRAVNRFDDPSGAFGVAYAGHGIEVAFAETVLHDGALFIDGEWLVTETQIQRRYVVAFEPKALRLADLRGAQLKRLGLDNALSAGSAYGETMALARDLHEQIPACDGIAYVSRQYNVGMAVALFERSGVRALPVPTALASHPGLPGVFDLFGVEPISSGRPPPGVT